MTKKTLLQFILLLFPFFTFAQSEPPVYKDFNKKVREITTSFKLNDHVWIMQTCTGKDNFELAAVNDKMQVLWRTTLSGYPLAAGKFKGHILAISAAKFEWVRRNVLSPYTAFLVDEETGKLLLQKVIYDGKSETKEFPDTFFNDDGSNFTLVVRQSDQGTAMFGYPTKLNTIKDLIVIKLDDNLNPIVSHPKFPDEEFINVACNNMGDLFLITHKEDKAIKVTRYEAPKFLPQDPIVQEMDVHKESDLKDIHGESTTPITDRYSVYFALFHDNADKDNELTAMKFNFTDRAVKTTSEVFTHAHTKEIEKAYVPFDTKQDKPDIGPRGLRMKYITEWDGTLVVVLSNQNVGGGGNTGVSSYADETSLIINGYDSNLTRKFQQMMPNWYSSYGFHRMAAYGEKNSLYMLANTADGINKWTCYYGKLDLTTGSWLKLGKLPKDKLDRKAIFDPSVMWFTNGFIIPYSSMSLSGADVSIQFNTY